MIPVLPLLVLLAFLPACTTGPSGTGGEEALYDYDVEERISSLGLELTQHGKPVANYVNALRTGDLVFMEGLVPGNHEKG